MRLAKNLFIILIINIIFVNPSWAATKAWVIGVKAQKLSVETNAIEKEVARPRGLGRLFYDARKGNIFSLYHPGRGINKIAVFDVKTLQRKGELDFDIGDLTTNEVQILFPSSDNLFYLRWVEEEDGPPEIIAYDATTFKSINSYSSTPPTTKKLMLSAAGDSLYSIVRDENIIKIDIFQTSDFTYKSSVDLKKFFGPNVTGFGMRDYKNGRLIISETSSTESLKYIYDISKDTISKKVAIKGDAYLLSETNKIASLEEQYVGKFKSMVLSTDYLFTGKVNVFDATTGQKVGFFQIPVSSNTIADIIAVSPLEDKLYVRTYNDVTDNENPKLYIINLKTNTIANEIPLPNVSVQMIFFEE